MLPLKMENTTFMEFCPVQSKELLNEIATLIQTASSRFHLTVPLTAEICFRKPLLKLSVYVASKIKASMFPCIVLKCKSQLLLYTRDYYVMPIIVANGNSTK